MKNSELYYAELLRLKKNEGKIPSQSRLSVSSTIKKASLTSHKQRIVPKTDWISVAEISIPSLRKAISQDRKRLYNEIIREHVELVRKTSSVTVKELSKHSESLKETNDGIMPETLYVPRNDEDYYLYDNRFLYTVCCTLRNFIDVQLSGAAASSTGCDRLLVDLCYGNDENSMKFRGEYEAASTFFDGKYADSAFTRIELLMEECEELLNSELLSRFTENDILELPIQPTNVIMMDPDFIVANELLDYLSSYSGNGYTVEEISIDSRDCSQDSFSDLEALLPLIGAICEAETGGIDIDLLLRLSENGESVYDLIKSGIPLSDEKLLSAIKEVEDRYEKLRIREDEKIQEKTARILKNKEEEFEKERIEYEGRIRALEIALGKVEDGNYTSEESFLVLEKEKAEFDRFYYRNLKRMKKEARKHYVWDVLFEKMRKKDKSVDKK